MDTAQNATGPADESRDPLDLLAEQFLQAVRRGEKVTPESFAAAHPDHSASLLDLLPTLLLLEQAKRDRETTASGGRRLSIPQLQRLGDFRIVREVGRGGMGVVFEAEQESLGRRVALKVLPQASLLTGHQLERFRREAQVAARLHHTHIVPVFDSGEADGFHYYAMQFIDGRSLDVVVRDLRQQSQSTSTSVREHCRWVARLGSDVASAIDHAHAGGTLHRDIKPANLLLDDKDHVWVTDFGLAKALQQEGLTHSGDVLGTLQYMAPEQFSGTYDVRSEVYALGATLYELIAARPAFTAATRSELMDRIRAGRRERLGRGVPGVPRDLETIVDRAMAVEPRARYASARELGDDLRAFLEDRPIAARRQSSAERFVYWCRRNRALAAVGATAVLAVVTAAIVGWTSYWMTADALGQAKNNASLLQQASLRDRANLKDTLQVFEDVFDTLVGPDPLQMLIDDDSDSPADLAMRAPLDGSSLALLGRLLEFYDKFAQRNQDSVELRAQTARAHARVGAIQARLGDLDAAVAAYEKAIARFRDVTAQDVTRDLAGLQQELGQVQVRRWQPAAAAACYEQSLKLLEGDHSDASRASRRLQARAHYLLATVHRLRDDRPMDGMRRGGPMGFPGRGARGRDGMPREGMPLNGRGGQRGDPRGARGQDPRPFDAGPAVAERYRNEARGHLNAALQLVEGLLAEQPEDAETQFLKARCLLAQSRGPGGPGGPSGGSDRQTEREKAKSLLNSLVTAHPDVEQYRFGLVEALLSDRREADAMADLERAVTEAETLLARRKTHPEYQALLGRCLSQLGSALNMRDSATDRRAGAAQLQRALDLQRPLQAERGATEPRLTVDLIASLRRLMRIEIEAREPVAARALAQELFDRTSEALRSAALRPDDSGLRANELFSLLERTGLGDLAARLRELIEQQADRTRDGNRRGR